MNIIQSKLINIQLNQTNLHAWSSNDSTVGFVKFIYLSDKKSEIFECVFGWARHEFERNWLCKADLVNEFEL